MRRLLLAASLSLIFSHFASACSCISSGGCPGLGGKANPVFLGTVLDVTDLPRTAEFSFLNSRKARIQVNESFGGLPAGISEVDVFTGSGGGDCGIPFRAGEVYLIDAFPRDEGLIHVGICSSTRRIEGGSNTVLQVLRQRRDGQPVPSLAGRIALHERNFDGPLGTHAPRPLPNTKVRVKADDKIYETISDAEGLYSFYNLSSGKYSFAPDLPSGTTLSWYIGSDKPLGAFELSEGDCKERSIEVFRSGSIQGSVFDGSNNLLPYARVYIVPTIQEVLPQVRRLYWESQGKEGSFKFVHLPPGKYVILVNPDDRQNPDFPYRRTFSPGVHDRESAAIITIHGGEQIKDADIHLEPPFETRHLKVRVTWVDGRLIKDFVSVEARGTENPAAMAHTKQPDLKASLVDLTILPNESYKIEAKLICRYGDEQSMGPGATLLSSPVYLGPKDDRTELVLTIPANACPQIPGKTLLSEQ